MNSDRPVFLNLVQFHFPIAAVMSVGHRAAGVLMVLTIPFTVYLLDLSLMGPEGYEKARVTLQLGLVKLALLLALWALMHHLLAGIRFLLIDFDIGVGKAAGRRSAILVMVLAPFLALGVGALL